jgi:hypothetical protein
MSEKSPGIAKTNPNTLTMTFDTQRTAPLRMGEPWQQLGAAFTTVHELTHVFTKSPIILSPQIPMTPEIFGLDLSKYKKREDGEIVGLDHYTSVDEDVAVDMYRGVIQRLSLYPRKADNEMRCKPPGKTEAKPEGDRL